MQHQYPNDDRFKPLHELSKKIYLNMKQLKSFSDYQSGGYYGNESDEAFKPWYHLAKDTYLDLKHLQKMEKELGISH